MANPFVHVELNTTDLGRARNFYGSLFGWVFEDVDMTPGHPYTMIRVGDGTGGGMMTEPVAGWPSHWTAYVGVADVRAATEQARALGATVLTEPMEMKNAGWLAVIRDPTGAALGLWQDKAGHAAELPIAVGV
jgi:predicted enzyme related to lactoylglutathione lyase